MTSLRTPAAEPQGGVPRLIAVRHLRGLLLAALSAAALTGCGDSGTDVTVAGPSDGSTAAAGACLTGATDCADIPTGTGGPQSRPDGSLLLSDAVDAGVDGPFLVAAYYVDAGEGARLCSALLESFPPQCGEPSLALDDSSSVDPTDLTTEGEVTWSADPVTVEGEIDGDTFLTR